MLKLILPSVMLLVGVSAAEAGQSYHCRCNGTVVFRVASTFACEKMRPNHPDGAPRTFAYFRAHRCTADEYKSWHRKACAETKCVPARAPVAKRSTAQ